MSIRRHYENAPITEAIIDLRADLAAGVGLSQLERISEHVAHGYPKGKPRRRAMGVFELGESASASAHSETIGHIFESSDDRQILQVQLTGFSFSRLMPYESWEAFRDEARRLWDIYRAVTCPQRVTRLAVRYVNRIDVPGNRVDLKEYFRTAPEISPDLSQQVEGFFMQLRLPLPDLPGIAIINQTIVPPPQEGVVSIVLDIDVFRGDAISQDESAIWDFFETLHERKNVLFEACITDAARRLFR
jgi:uncharacterized protein (TIGR04255 family)